MLGSTRVLTLARRARRATTSRSGAPAAASPRAAAPPRRAPPTAPTKPRTPPVPARGSPPGAPPTGTRRTRSAPRPFNASLPWGEPDPWPFTGVRRSPPPRPSGSSSSSCARYVRLALRRGEASSTTTRRHAHATRRGATRAFNARHGCSWFGGLLGQATGASYRPATGVESRGARYRLRPTTAATRDLTPSPRRPSVQRRYIMYPTGALSGGAVGGCRSRAATGPYRLDAGAATGQATAGYRRGDHRGDRRNAFYGVTERPGQDFNTTGWVQYYTKATIDEVRAHCPKVMIRHTRRNASTAARRSCSRRRTAHRVARDGSRPAMHGERVQQRHACAPREGDIDRPGRGREREHLRDVARGKCTARRDARNGTISEIRHGVRRDAQEMSTDRRPMAYQSPQRAGRARAACTAVFTHHTPVQQALMKALEINLPSERWCISSLPT